MRLVMVLGAVGALAGCGGRQTTPTSTTPATSTTALAPPGLAHRELVARLNAICDTYNQGPAKELRGDLARLQGNDYDGIAAVVGLAADETEPYITQAQALEPRPSDAGALRRYVRALRRQVGVQRRLATAYRYRDAGDIETFTAAGEDASRQRILAAIDLGADRCGR